MKKSISPVVVAIVIVVVLVIVGVVYRTKSSSGGLDAKAKEYFGSQMVPKGGPAPSVPVPPRR